MEKIKGKFVNIREADGKYYLDYRNELGQLTWVNILYHCNQL